MQHGHHLLFVGLSVAVAIFGAWTALDLFRRVRLHVGQAQRIWLAATAIVMGTSIWAMHFVAMLGFEPGPPVSYDPALTLLSLLVAIGATSGAFFAASRPGLPNLGVVVAGVAMGAGICAMHYIGMSALRTDATLGYSAPSAGLAFLIAVAAATAALFAAKRDWSVPWRFVAAVILGLAVVGMHYTAMAGLTVSAATEHMEAGAPPFLLGIAVSTGTLVILILALMASLYDQRLNVLAALDGGDVGYWEFDLKTQDLRMSPRAKTLFLGDPEADFTYQDLMAVVPPGDHERRREIFERAVAEDLPYDIEYRLDLPTGGFRWVNTRGRVVGWANGRPRRMAGVVLDITDRHDAYARLADADRRQRLLIDELNHRVKNSLATVQSIARQTAKGSTSLETFRGSFEARLMSLSNTHNLLTRGSWEQAKLRDILMQETAPYPAEQVTLVGPEVGLNSRETLALGMIFHELVTNAVKYGALSAPDGRLRVSWGIETGRLHLQWREEAGPRVTAPALRGFGSTLIERLALRELGGEAQVDYRSEGFSFSLAVPIAQALQAA